MKTVLDLLNSDNSIILFDGVCNLCHGGVIFLIKLDRQKKFKFAALQSEISQSILKHLEIQTIQMDSFILIDQQKYYTKSNAALRVFLKMGKAWSLVYFFIIIPKSIRDWIYDYIANHRYQWFGQKDQYMMPTPDIQSRFL